MSIDRAKKLWGLHPMQEAYFNSLLENNSQLVPARIIFSSHDQYKILILGSNEEKSAKVRGHFYHEGEELPVVGDWVAIELAPGDHQNLPIEAILPRTSGLKRQDSKRGYQTLVANVDFVGLVTSFNNDLNERRLERGLAMIEESGAKPIIILNKSDLLDEESAKQYLKDLSNRLGEISILACSAQSGSGVAEIKKMFSPGQSIAFLGMSGVGKSSLINAILGEEVLDTKEIREEDSRGRHTTTHREVFLSKDGFWIIDNPGIRAFSFSGGDEALESTFDDISQLMSQCRFTDCTHKAEPGCKVIEALDSGELSTDRWENYLKIKKEVDFQTSKYDKAARAAKRKEWAKIHVDLRARLKAKGRK